MSCTDEHVDDGGTVCARCGDVLERVRRAIELRRKCGASKRGRGRCALQLRHDGDHDNGAGGRWSDKRAPRKKGRKKKEVTRWSLLETD